MILGIFVADVIKFSEIQLSIVVSCWQIMTDGAVIGMYPVEDEKQIRFIDDDIG